MKPKPLPPSDILRACFDISLVTGEIIWKRGRRKGKLASYINRQGYIHVYLNGKSRLAHRLVYKYWYGSDPPEYIDHINGIKTDNRLCNLRAANAKENSRNRGATGKSEYKGVGWHKPKSKWRACIRINGKHKFLGYYSEELDAAEAYNHAAKTIHKDFFYQEGNHEA